MVNMDERAAHTACTTRPCLEQHEGELIDVEGTYVFPKQKAFAVNRLALKDGTTIILSPPENELRDHFASENDNTRLLIRGRIFTGPIPDKYRIIGRTPEPYLLDIEKIEKL
jgi:hypothetical protein